jgi:predicted glycosyltransferase
MRARAADAVDRLSLFSYSEATVGDGGCRADSKL